MDTIVVILYKRPEYTKQVLDSLSAQPTIKNYHVHFQIDSCIKEVIDLAVSFSATSKTININGRNAGCTMNVYMGIENGFSMSDFVVYLEDDTLPSHDFLKYIEWAKPYIGDDCRIISAYHKFENCPENLYNTVHWMPRTCMWGFATTKHHWEEAKKVWDWSSPTSWDLMIAHNYFWQRKTIMPYLSRVRNIGSTNGTYVHSEEQHAREVWVNKWADSVPKELLTEFIFQPNIPENEDIMWEESKDYLYADTRTQV